MGSLNPQTYKANEARLQELTAKYGNLTLGPEFFAVPSSTVEFEPSDTAMYEDLSPELKACVYQARLDHHIQFRELVGAWRFDFEHGLREPWSPVEKLLLDVWHGEIKYEDLMWKVENESTKLMTEDMVEYYFDHLGSWVDEYEAAVRLVEKCAGVGASASLGVTLTEEERQSLASSISSLDTAFRPTVEVIEPSNDRRFKLRHEEVLVIDKAIAVFSHRHGRKWEFPFEVISQNIYKSWLYAIQINPLQMTTRQEILAFHKWISSQYPSPSELRKRLQDCRRFLLGAIREQQRTPGETEQPPSFLGLTLDVTHRTVRRDGKDVPIPIRGEISWQLLVKLVQARGRELTNAEVAKLPGSSKSPARRKRREAMNLTLYPLDVSISEAGWVLQSVR